VDNEQQDFILTCPNCGTRYHAPAAPGGSRAATYRCATCENVFSVETTSGENETDERPVQSAFDFDALDACDEIEDEPVEARNVDEPSTGKDVPAFTWNAEGPRADQADLPPEPAFMVASNASGEPDLSTMRTSGGRSWLRIGARFEAAVLVAFGAIALYLISAPDIALKLVEILPYASAGIGSGERQLHKISVVETHGFRDLSRENRPRFIIAGKVVNSSPAAVGALQVEGRIYSRGKEVARKVVFAGAKASRRLVRRLSAAEISMLEKIKPPETYRLRPGASERFLIIFQDVPPTLDEFGCRVVSVRPVSG